MTPLMWAILAVAVFIGGALVLRSTQRQSDSTPATGAVAQLFAHEPLRMRSQFDVETDEDLLVIEKVYREQRTSERARQALERLAPLVPTAKK